MSKDAPDAKEIAMVAIDELEKRFQEWLTKAYQTYNEQNENHSRVFYNGYQTAIHEAIHRFYAFKQEVKDGRWPTR
jgi:hypothetical protein